MSDEQFLNPGLSHLHPVSAPNTKVRSYFVAKAGNIVSGPLDTEDKAIEWAHHHLAKNMGCTYVDVGIMTTRVERDDRPIKVTHLD